MNKSKYSIERVQSTETNSFHDVVAAVVMEEIPAELILNWDQTGIKIVPSRTWTMVRQGSKHVEAVRFNGKHLITAVFFGSLVGDFLPVQIINKVKTPRCHPQYQFPLDWDITHSPKHWSNERTMLQYVTKVIISYVKHIQGSFKEDTPALAIMDNFKDHVVSLVTDSLESNSIHVSLLDRYAPTQGLISQQVR